MPLLKRRPRVRLMLPKVVLPGERFQALVVLEAKREVEINSVKLELVGSESMHTGSGQGAAHRTYHLVRLRADLRGRGKLARGRHELPCNIELPQGLPPTYNGKSAGVSYELAVHVDIPWWPDVKARFEVNVGMRMPRYDDRPQVWVSSKGGPQGREAYIEAALPGLLLWPGGSLELNLALGNVSFNRYKRVEVALVCHERVMVGRRRGELVLDRYAWQLDSRDLHEGESTLVRLGVPDKLVPTLESSHFSVAWRLELRGVVSWGRDILIGGDVVMLPGEPPESARAPRYAAPSVGSERVQSIWREVGDEVGLELDGNRLVGTFAGHACDVRREHHGSDGIFLVGRLELAPLGIGLRVVTARGLGGYIGPQLGWGRWDRKHRVAARFDEQAVAYLSHLAPLASDELSHVEVDDESVALYLRDAGQRAAPLRTLCSLCGDVASALGEAREAIPAPPTHAETVDGWRQLASSLERAQLEVGPMALRGLVGGTPCEITTLWRDKGAPELTRLALLPAQAPGSSYHVTLVAAPGVVLDSNVPQLPRDVQPLLADLLADAIGFSIDARGLILDLDAPLSDPPQAHERLLALAKLYGRLRPGSGPFR
ncbi:MAG: hypothetical protein KC503_15525 [Myxococcales bacterium]|nr:hypothetical protein [Myxococcales bacterium]